MRGISWLREDMFAFPGLSSIKLAGYLLSSVTHPESKYEYGVYMTNVKQFMEKAVIAATDGSVTSCVIYYTAVRIKWYEIRTSKLKKNSYFGFRRSSLTL